MPFEIAPERLDKIRQAWEEYHNSMMKGEPINISTLASKYQIPYSTLTYHFRRFKKLHGEEALKEPERVAKTQIREGYASRLTDEAKTTVDMALAIGTELYTKYRPIMQMLQEKHESIDRIVDEIMSWYEKKDEIEEELQNQNIRIKDLEREVSELLRIADPNLRFMLMRNAYLNAYRELVKADIIYQLKGEWIDVSHLINMLKRDLNIIANMTSEEMYRNLHSQKGVGEYAGSS